MWHAFGSLLDRDLATAFGQNINRAVEINHQVLGINQHGKGINQQVPRINQHATGINHQTSERDVYRPSQEYISVQMDISSFAGIYQRSNGYIVLRRNISAFKWIYRPSQEYISVQTDISSFPVLSTDYNQ